MNKNNVSASANPPTGPQTTEALDMDVAYYPLALLLPLILCLSSLHAGSAASITTGTADGTELWGYVEVRPSSSLLVVLQEPAEDVDAIRAMADSSLAAGRPALSSTVSSSPSQGASGVGLGNFQEIGPLDVDLKPRNSTWLQKADLIFVDNPVGTGYSYVEDDSLFVTTDWEQAAYAMTLLKALIKEVPTLQSSPLFLVAESYGGKYAATLGVAVARAVRAGELNITLGGVAVGDSWISPEDFTLSYTPLLLSVSRLDDNAGDEANKRAETVKEQIVAGQWAASQKSWGDLLGFIATKSGDVDVYNFLLDSGMDPVSSVDTSTGSSLSNLQAKNTNTIDSIMNGVIKDKLKIIPKDFNRHWHRVFSAAKLQSPSVPVGTVDTQSKSVSAPALRPTYLRRALRRSQRTRLPQTTPQAALPLVDMDRPCCSLALLLPLLLCLCLGSLRAGSAASVTAGTPNGSERWGYVEIEMSPHGRPSSGFKVARYATVDSSRSRHGKLRSNLELLCSTLCFTRIEPERMASFHFHPTIGASGVGLGNFLEVGPLDVNLKPRNSTWLQKADLIFVDNPVGVGYSYVEDDSLLVKTDWQQAADATTLLKALVKELPTLQSSPLFLVAESYGGKYAATLGASVARAVRTGELKIKLAGQDSILPTRMSTVSRSEIAGSRQRISRVSRLDDNAGGEANKKAKDVKRQIEAGQFAAAQASWSDLLDFISTKSGNVDLYNFLLDSGMDPVSADTPTTGSSPSSVQALMYATYLGSQDSDSNTIDGIMNGAIKEKLKIVPKNLKPYSLPTLLLPLLLCFTLGSIPSGSAAEPVTAGTPDGSELWGYVEVRPSNNELTSHGRPSSGFRVAPYALLPLRPPPMLELRSSLQAHSQSLALSFVLLGWQGASGVGFGNFQEMGPLDVNLQPRNSTWLQKADLIFVVCITIPFLLVFLVVFAAVIFVYRGFEASLPWRMQDNPVGVGYSYVEDDSLLVKTDWEQAADAMTLLKALVKEVPTLQSSPLFLVAESYGGKYAATIGVSVARAVRAGELNLTLGGVALGDSWISPEDFTLSYTPVLLSVSRLDDNAGEEASKIAETVKEQIAAGNFTDAEGSWSDILQFINTRSGGVDVYNFLTGSLDPASSSANTPTGSSFPSTVHGMTKYSRYLSGEGSGPNTIYGIMNGVIKDKLKIIPKNLT
ncbi:hypothetical protein HU200_018188 [Digitaria exilis]|uniref:Carboxypeptidase n=1 Tax=Digitaria exilis TaxID=1010633 RepID=A0A835F5G6_9POAL|nr:hypothetical protein HU200_018188 [Digitaria exilis]